MIIGTTNDAEAGKTSLIARRETYKHQFLLSFFSELPDLKHQISVKAVRLPVFYIGIELPLPERLHRSFIESWLHFPHVHYRHGSALLINTHPHGKRGAPRCSFGWDLRFYRMLGQLARLRIAQQWDGLPLLGGECECKYCLELHGNAIHVRFKLPVLELVLQCRCDLGIV